ncbi:MAG: mechanosensitive ion channel, partial [Candidatus Thermoplasmatota archaeon]|nr:mechanosensitive ion channel [Candidatus Thermoplasmatota archaeon]
MLLTEEHVRFFLVLLVAIIAVTLAHSVMKLVIKKFAGKKKSYSQFVIKKLSKPTFYLIFFTGLFVALRNLSITNRYTFTIGSSVHNWVDGVFFVLLVFLLALFISRLIGIFMVGWLKVTKSFDRTPGLINKIVTAIIYVVAIFVVMGYFNIDITPMIAGVGLGALAIGLALQSTLSNFFAGVHLLSDRPINVGDFIELGPDTSGTVEDIGWRSTRIRLLTDNLLIIPNGKLAESNIINYSMPKQDMAIWVP